MHENYLACSFTRMLIFLAVKAMGPGNFQMVTSCHRTKLIGVLPYLVLHFALFHVGLNTTKAQQKINLLRNLLVHKFRSLHELLFGLVDLISIGDFIEFNLVVSAQAFAYHGSVVKLAFELATVSQKIYVYV